MDSAWGQPVPRRAGTMIRGEQYAVGTELKTPHGRVDWESIEQAREHMDAEEGDVLMRRDATPHPWLPVEQGDES